MSDSLPASIKKDLRGQTFGRLTVVSFSHKVKNKSYWLCVCACGTEKVILGVSLSYGSTRSCGCLKLEPRSRLTIEHPRAFRSWLGMRNRCLNPNNTSYYKYGKRGIRVCARWVGSFANFLADMGDPPPNTTLDRIDNESDYTPSNCRWATPVEQASNTRRNVRITHKGQTLTAAQWATLLGINRSTFYKRLNRSGWDTATALETPVPKDRRSNVQKIL